MRSYEERLPLIDEAIDYYKGKLPREANPDATLIIVAFGSYYFISEEYFNTCGIESEFVCYEEEFEQRAKELGYIRYRYGVEYETNSENPKGEPVGEIPASVLERVDRLRTKAEENQRIEDNQKEQKMNNDWYEKGELPPANIECEVKIEGQWLPTVVIGHYANEAVVVDPCVTVQRFFCTTVNNLRPLQSETDKLVDEALETLKSDYATHLSLSDLDLKMCAETMIEAGYRKVKPMGEDEFMQNALKYFEINQFLIYEALRKLYSAGCRFIDQGE